MWHEFAAGTFVHKALIWGTAICLGAAEFFWARARLLWRQWVKGKSLTKARLWYELTTAILLTLVFGLYVLERLKW